MKYIIMYILLIITYFYIFFSIFALLDGLFISNYSSCKNITRASYLFPAHRLGCWLGEVP